MKQNIKSKIKSTVTFADILLCVMLFAATLLGGYGGYFNPEDTVLPAVMLMAFPYLALLCVVVIIANLFFKRWLSAVGGVTLLLCAGPLLTASPLHFSSAQSANGKLSTDTFSVMTFNSYYFNSFKSVELDSVAADQTTLAILEADPSIVVMQEAVPYDPFAVGSNKVSPYLSASIRQLYPYRSFPSSTMSIMSKYPFKRTLHYFNSEESDSFLLDTYDVYIGDTTVHIINVHLQSLLIQKSDLGLVMSIKNLFTNTRAITAAREIVIPKIALAFRKRAFQAEVVRNIIESLSPGPIVLCGDFNDVPGCYAIRTIAGNTLHDSYEDAAFGPSVTYRANHLYFRIDHILYSDGLNPIQCRTVKAGGSDHYPVMATFDIE